jgi:uncharacterized damage-inducible protein DinB
MTTLDALFDHNRWANERLLEGCRDLRPEQLAASVEGTYGDLGATLAHIASGEVYYVALLTGWKPATEWQQDDPFPGVEPLLEVVHDAGLRLADAARSIPPDRRIEHDEDGPVPASIIFVQAIDHATEHRTHARTILSQLGLEPPAVDGWEYATNERP